MLLHLKENRFHVTLKISAHSKQIQNFFFTCQAKSILLITIINLHSTRYLLFYFYFSE